MGWLIFVNLIKVACSFSNQWNSYLYELLKMQKNVYMLKWPEEKFITMYIFRVVVCNKKDVLVWQHHATTCYHHNSEQKYNKVKVKLYSDNLHFIHCM